MQIHAVLVTEVPALYTYLANHPGCSDFGTLGPSTRLTLILSASLRLPNSGHVLLGLLTSGMYAPNVGPDMV